MLVGVVLVGAMDLLGNVIRGRTSTADVARAEQFARQLMVEILNADYKDDTLPLFGTEVDELIGVRSGYDDVDDFHNWSPLSPIGLDGNPLVNSTGWQREVKVENVDPANPGGPALSNLNDQGVKRITVTVKHDGQEVTWLVALRSDKYTAE
jgi:hypothetical protein